ncbi:MAG: phosphoribosylglycinamide formyltransferase [Bacteroidales bacterium]|nr:phosphoribosylglycinamide formyltransferase [Bacteroidales bacterium]
MEKHPIAVFASGIGTNFEAIDNACKDGRIPAEVVLVVCDRPGAQVVAKAKERGISVFEFSPKDYPSKADFEKEIVEELDRRKVELVCLAGYMRIVGPTLLSAYEGRIINIHPSLLPAFKGANAVERAVEYGVKVYGISVHWVSSDLDGGKIIAQRAFPYEGNDPEEVHALGRPIEHQLYVEVIKKLLTS